jgi:hypothetical protein
MSSREVDFLFLVVASATRINGDSLAGKTARKMCAAACNYYDDLPMQL